MDNLENLHPQKQIHFVEQSRETLLHLGYRYVVFKSKAKKYTNNLKKQIILFYS